MCVCGARVARFAKHTHTRVNCKVTIRNGKFWTLCDAERGFSWKPSNAVAYFLSRHPYGIVCMSAAGAITNTSEFQNIDSTSVSHGRHMRPCLLSIFQELLHLHTRTFFFLQSRRLSLSPLLCKQIDMEGCTTNVWETTQTVCVVAQFRRMRKAG